MIRLKPGTKRSQEAPLRISLYRLWTLVLLAVFGLGASHARAQESISETEVKAAFILQTAKYVDWPKNTFPNENAPIRVAIFSNDDELVNRFTTSLRGQKANGRPFTVRKINAPHDARDSDIVFIGEAEGRRTQQIAEVLKNAPVLTVGESAQFFENGGMIHVFFENGKIRWEINLWAAEKAGMVISSKMLGLAKRVIREERK